MMKLIIFCAVSPIFLGLFTFSPNFLSEHLELSPNLFTEDFCKSPKLFALSPNFFVLSPNFFRLQCTFRGYYLPCWPPPQQVSFRILLSSNYRMWYRKKSLPFDIMFFARQEFISIYMYSNWVNLSAMTFVSRYLYSYSQFYTHIHSQT